VRIRNLVFGSAYFLTHVHQLQPVTLLMIGAGGALGGWLALGKQKD